jgi:NAD(P)-dependent dehydrogenase (short-subunit alcohol dehydrogenase family)
MLRGDGVSSVHQRIPTPSYLRYSVSKGGMAIPTTTLAPEYGRHGIRANGIRRLPRAPVVGMIGAGSLVAVATTYSPRSLALRSMQNSLPSGSASTTHPVPSVCR